MNRILSVSVVFGVLGLILLSSCTLAPKYTRPQSPVPERWPTGKAYENIAALSEKASVSKIAWQDFFADERMKQVIKLALENNSDLRLAILNVEKARASYGVQRAELYPAINIGADKIKQRNSADLTPKGMSRTTTEYDINLGISSWEIDLFGRIRSLAKQALEQYLATEQAKRSVRIALIFEVARAYLTLAADKENLSLAKSTLKTQQEMYSLIENQYKIGIANKLDLERAKTQVETARQSVISYTQSVAQDVNALNLLTGVSVPNHLLTVELDDINPPKDISPGLSSDILLQRPDIIEAEHQLKASYAYIGAARAAFFPRITLTSSWGTASDELSGLFAGGTETWSFAPRIVMPIFDARTWAAYKVSKEEQKIAIAQYQKTIQTAFKEVADALAIRGTIDGKISAQQSLVKALDEAYRLSLKRYKSGIDSYLSVLDAQRSLFDAKQMLISLRLAKFVNRVQLYSVLGGGDESAENQSSEGKPSEQLSYKSQSR